MRHKLVHNVLHCTISTQVKQWMCLMDLEIALGAMFACLKVLHNTALADYKYISNIVMLESSGGI